MLFLYPEGCGSRIVMMSHIFLQCVLTWCGKIKVCGKGGICDICGSGGSGIYQDG